RRSIVRPARNRIFAHSHESCQTNRRERHSGLLIPLDQCRSPRGLNRRPIKGDVNWFLSVSAQPNSKQSRETCAYWHTRLPSHSTADLREYDYIDIFKTT